LGGHSLKVLDMVEKVLAHLKKTFTPLVTQAGYGHIHYQDSKQEKFSVALSSRLPALTLLKSIHF